MREPRARSGHLLLYSRLLLQLQPVPSLLREPLARLCARDYSFPLALRRRKLPRPTSYDADALLERIPKKRMEAFEAAVVGARSEDDILSACIRFSKFLQRLRLPRTFESIDLQQAYKDIKRERVEINGEEVTVEGPEELETILRPLLTDFTFDSDAEMRVVQDIVRACSRTASGGDAYFVVTNLFGRKPGYAVLPGRGDPGPVVVNISRTGEGSFITRSEFEVRCIDPHEAARQGAHPKQMQFRTRHSAAEWRVFSRGIYDLPVHAAQLRADDPRDEASVVLALTAVIEEKLDFVRAEGSRVLRIVPHRLRSTHRTLVVSGAGTVLANGVYTRVRFQHGSPMFRNNHGVCVSVERVGPSAYFWVIGHPPVAYYYQRIEPGPEAYPGGMLPKDLLPLSEWAALTGLTPCPKSTVAMHKRHPSSLSAGSTGASASVAASGNAESLPRRAVRPPRGRPPELPGSDLAV